MITPLKPRLRWIPIHAREVAQIIEWTIWRIAQNGANFADRVLLDPDLKLLPIELHRLHHGRVPSHQAAQRGMRLQLLDIRDGRRERHQTSPRLVAVSP